MCGIAALFLAPQERPTAVWQALRENITANLLFNEDRGRSATGLIVLDVNGEARLFKQPLPAREFTETAVYHQLLQTIGPRTTLVLGHTRLPTKGDPARSGNNHPIQVGTVYGVHNGRIQNDDNLFAQGPRPRLAEVDSEIIFRLIAEGQGQPQKIKAALEELQGEFTFIAGDGRAPARLLVVKHRNPLALHYQADWQALVFTSRYTFLRKAFGPTVAKETIPADYLLLYDAFHLQTNQYQPALALALNLNQAPADPH